MYEQRGVPEHRLCTLLVGASLLFICASHQSAAQTTPRYPFPQHVAYAPGTIRPNRRTQAQLDDDVRAAYSRWKSYYLAPAGAESDGTPRYRVRFSTAPSSKTVSEGQGYGMMIVALMAGADPDARKYFDGLWHFFNDHRSAGDRRLMDWTVPADEHDDGDNNSAFDGDADIAFGLLLADRQWGSSGKIAYRREAEDVIAGILAAEIGPQSRLPMLGDWVTSGGDPKYNQYTPRPSDFMPDHFRAFARATGNSVWLQVATACQNAAVSLQNSYAPATGLLPDFAVPLSTTNHTLQPAPPNFLENPTDGDYSYNAGRVPWRFATDALLTSDSISATVARRITRWARAAAAGNPQNIKPGYRLDGTPIPPGDYFTIFFAAPIGVAAMTAPEQQAWLNAIYDAVRAAHEGYYEDTVTLLCLLVMTANGWDPTNPPAAPSAARLRPW